MYNLYDFSLCYGEQEIKFFRISRKLVS